jgi:hypothetical protein
VPGLDHVPAQVVLVDLALPGQRDRGAADRNEDRDQAKQVRADEVRDSSAVIFSSWFAGEARARCP